MPLELVQLADMDRKTPEEEEAILESIEKVASELSLHVSELQTFLRELKASRQRPISIQKGQGESRV